MNCAGTEFSTVHVTGPFCGWCGGEEWNTMSDEDGDGVYSLTLYNIEAPFEYKYMIDGFAGQEDLWDDMADGADCAPITDYWSFGNRQLDATGNGTEVNETYGSCMTCDEQAAMLVSTINFEVDMSASQYPNADYDNVVINGSWNGWNGWGVTLADDGDGVYTGSLTLDVGTSFEYVVAVTGSADGWSGWGQQFGQPACNGANFTATAPADGNTSTTVSISVDDLVADACGVCDGDDSTCTDDCGVVNGDGTSCAPYDCMITDLSATGGMNEVFLQWGACDGATSYNVYRDGELIGSSPVNGYQDSTQDNGFGLGYDTQYCYTVEGVNEYGTASSASNDACATTLPALQAFLQVNTSLANADVAAVASPFGDLTGDGVADAVIMIEMVNLLPVNGYQFNYSLNPGAVDVVAAIDGMYLMTGGAAGLTAQMGEVGPSGTVIGFDFAGQN